MPHLRKAERLRRERISRSLLAYYREQRRAELLRRERISASLLAYYEEQRRLTAVRVEAALTYWRRVKQAAGRHGLTVDQARRVLRIAGQQAIPVTQAVPQVKVVRPPAPPVPPPRVLPPVPPPTVPLLPEIPEPEAPLPAPEIWAASDVTREEIAWNLKEVVEAGYEVHPRSVLPARGTLEAEFKVFVRGQFQRVETVEFESARGDEDFWSNFYAALRPVHDETVDDGFESGDISITVMAIRMA